MIIFQNGIIVLEYDPSSDILFVAWPDVQDYLVPEVQQTLQILVEHIKNYDIKKLLIDSSKASLEIPGSEYKEVLKKFGLQLMTTRLEKLARVLTPDPMRENKVDEAKEEVNFTIALRTFTSKTQALEWLKDHQN